MNYMEYLTQVMAVPKNMQQDVVQWRETGLNGVVSALLRAFTKPTSRVEQLDKDTYRIHVKWGWSKFYFTCTDFCACAIAQEMTPKIANMGPPKHSATIMLCVTPDIEDAVAVPGWAVIPLIKECFNVWKSAQESIKWKHSTLKDLHDAEQKEEQPPATTKQLH